MKNQIRILILLFCFPLLNFAQDDDDSQDYAMVELNYMKAKPGMESKFVQAVKKHNASYHADGPYEATLHYIRTGNDAGWYVWAMGTFTYTDLDNAPGAGAHQDDWSKTIAPYVQEYGPIEMWRYNDKLSVSNEESESLETIWFMDIERGEGYRFRAFMEKVKKVFEDKDDEMHVWNNQYSQDDGREVAIVWPFAKWADLDDDDDWTMKEAYDEEYGEGAWDNALEEWEDVVAGMTQEVWMRIPKD